MRLLIDGYNLMHAAGRMTRRFGPDGLRRARLRFLDDLADRLGPERSRETTVVFDASSLPVSQPSEGTHKGLTVIFAIEDEDADARIERLIAVHSSPKALTVVSSDRRIRRAASRRRARPVQADAFLDQLEAPGLSPGPPPETARDDRPDGPDPAEAAFWAATFAGPEVDEALAAIPDPVPPEWSDAEIARVAEQVEAEALPPGPADPFPPDDWTDEEMDRVAREIEAEFARRRLP